MRTILLRRAALQFPTWARNCARNYASATSSDAAKIVEVGPRDGLQNEKMIVPTDVKVDFVNRLSSSGLKCIEVSSFVSPKWIPQMADSVEVFQRIEKKSDVSYLALLLNMKGLETAIRVGAKEIGVFSTASETFCKTNANCTLEQNIKNLKVIVEEAKKHGIKIRGYLSCVFGCPYEGDTKPATTAHLASLMLTLGCYEVALGDTIGVGSPKKVECVLNELLHVSSNNMSHYALHLHDTYGQALVNVYAGLEKGIRAFDSSVAGLGGCPYATGASGNLSTEDLLYFLHSHGVETGVDFDKIVEIGDFICKKLGRANQSKTGIAVLAKKNRQKKD